MFQGMDYESSKEKLLEVLCSSDASNRSPRMLTIFDSILDAMIDNSNVCFRAFIFSFILVCVENNGCTQYSP